VIYIKLSQIDKLFYLKDGFVKVTSQRLKTADSGIYVLSTAVVIFCAISTFFLYTLAQAAEWMPGVWRQYMERGPVKNNLPDFSCAGYRMGSKPVPDIQAPVSEVHLFDVTSKLFGAVPDDGNDDTDGIQSAIDAAGSAGGGVVFLPRGRYEVHQKPENGFLRISHDNVILKGERYQPSTTLGDSELSAPPEIKTILHLGSPGPAGSIRRLGTVPAEKEGRHFTCVSVMGSEHSGELTRYTKTLLRGQKMLEVMDSSLLTPGQTVIVEFTDPLIDPENPLSDKADLAAQLTHPLKLVKDQTDTFGKYSKKITWITKIDKVIDKKTIVLSEPARFDQFLRYSPRILSFNGVEGVGVENLIIESSWPGGYRHHKPNIGEDGKIARTAMEQDYLWGGIWLSSASDGWIRNVSFRNLTQGIIFSRCASITARDLSFEGFDGHAGVTIAQSHGILVERADFFARLVHPISLKNFASGNVITDCETHYDGRNDNNSTDAVIDFHGLFPYENLFDNMRGFYVCPGGDTSVMPHAGVRNVFWNIEAPENMSCYSCELKDEFMRTYDYGNTSSGTPGTMYEYQPQGFFIGLTRRGDQKVTMGGISSDQHNKWMTVEGLNLRDIGITSLYKAQYNWRYHKK
jgi:hypothetical protein